LSDREPKVFALPARVDSSSAAGFETDVLAAIVGEGTRLIMDFASTTYMSSAGLRVVLLAAKKLKASGGDLVLCNLGAPIMEIFRVSGFARILTFAPDLAAAHATFR
jgi:anti-anti-sigma factor